MANKYRYQRAFTMIELMITIGIIAIIGCIVMFNYSKTKSEANLVACQHNIESIVTAETTYFASHNVYATLDMLIDGEFLKEIPKCPGSGKDYSMITATATGMDGITAYTLHCGGSHDNLSGVDENFPLYSNKLGKVVFQDSEIPNDLRDN